ncbi:M57 family metalloprotease [Corallococcus terminator]
MEAGFPATDIEVVDGVVYVGGDAAVSLQASREMLQTDKGSQEQYRTTNLISSSIRKICVNPTSTFNSYSRLSQGLDLAIQNYNQLGLTFTLARGPTTGCNANITATTTSGAGGSSGFPSGGNPYGTLNIGTGLNTYSVDVNKHVLTHELGHTIGFRHSDYYNRAISCGGAAVNEGSGGVGAILIPGTPSTATVGGSLMNSCFPSSTTGEFTKSDVAALRGLYFGPLPDPWLSITDVSSAAGSFKYWNLQVPAGKSQVTFKLSAGTGDVDLYARFGAPPTTTTYDCRPNLSGNNETCTFTLPQEGTYHVGLYGASSYSGVSLTGTYDDPPLCPPWPFPWRWPIPVGPPPPPPPPWDPIINIADSIVGHFNYWTLDVPSGQSVVTFTLSGGRGDADLYVNFGAAPTATTYQCRPYLIGNGETCTLTAPSAGTYYIGLHAYSAYSGATLTTTYTAGP